MNFEKTGHSKRRKYKSRLLFSFEEDQKLLDLINNISKNKKNCSKNCFEQSTKCIDEKLIDWKNISKKMGNRSVRQCKERYFHYLSPNINKNEWTCEEDFKLMTSVENFGKKWKIFEGIFKNRTEIDIRNRYYVLQRKITKAAKLESLTNDQKFLKSNKNKMKNTTNDKNIANILPKKLYDINLNDSLESQNKDVDDNNFLQCFENDIFEKLDDIFEWDF